MPHSDFLFEGALVISAIEVSGLFIYPIKSCSGISVTTAELHERGFDLDRRWMLVDEKWTFLSQRRFPHMALVHVSLQGNHLLVTGPGAAPLEIPREGDDRLPATVNVWRDTVQALRVSDAHDEWFSNILKIRCRLVWMPDNTRRPVDPQYGRLGDSVSFADAYPALVTTESSLEAVNRRLPAPIPMNRFRPNIVLRGSQAFGEDDWSVLRFPRAALRLVKPCARCVITTVDQSTGIAGPEPLETLATFRSVKNKVNFGQNAIPLTCGSISVGDRVVSEPPG